MPLIIRQYDESNSTKKGWQQKVKLLTIVVWDAHCLNQILITQKKHFGIFVNLFEFSFTWNESVLKWNYSRYVYRSRRLTVASSYPRIIKCRHRHCWLVWCFQMSPCSAFSGIPADIRKENASSRASPGKHHWVVALLCQCCFFEGKLPWAPKQI